MQWWQREAETPDVIWIIAVGLVAGAIAKLSMPRADASAIFVIALLGMVGALVGTLLGRLVGLYESAEGAGLVASIIGAIIALSVYRSVKDRQAEATKKKGVHHGYPR